LELLGAIDRHRSISAAARQLGMSYRRAWELVQSINEAAGEPLVSAATGGTRGGGAQLTELGKWAVAVFGELQGQLQQTAAASLSRLVAQSSTGGLHIAAAVSLEEALSRLVTDFALREPALRVRTVFGGSDELADQILGGAPVDLFLSADALQIDRLAAARLVGRGDRVDLAENGLAAIAPTDCQIAATKITDLVRDGAPKIVIADPSCPLGRYTLDCLEHSRGGGRILATALRAGNSRAVVVAVRARQAEVGLVYSSDAAYADGCRILFRLPRPRTPIRYSAAVISRGKENASARRLLEFLASAHGRRRFRECGFLMAQ
jgi:molybdate transport system substrate-binding protein